MMMNKCFGIISYLTWDQPERQQRENRLDRLINQLSALWPTIDILVIAQQWNHYTLKDKCLNKVIEVDVPPLGILGARQRLRQEFLARDYDYIIMLDDDAIIDYASLEDTKAYINNIDNNPQGFCFIRGGNNIYCPYADSQLNLCAISRYIYEKTPIPNVDAQKSQGFEDRIFSTLLHCKYADKEFDAPKGIRCCHFKNPHINDYGGEVPSTWARRTKYNWGFMKSNTLRIEKYIAEHKDLPEDLI